MTVTVPNNVLYLIENFTLEVSDADTGVLFTDYTYELYSSNKTVRFVKINDFCTR